MNDHKIIYTGFFIDVDELYANFSPKLANKIEYPHVTLKFRPYSDQIYPELFGEEVEIIVQSYGNNGRNEGVRVELKTGNPKICELIKTIKLPHITVAVADGAKPVNTRNLTFEPMAAPVVLRAKYGAFTPEGVILQ